MGMAAIYRKPVVHLAHSDISRAEIRNASDGQAVIYNSEWSRSQLEPGYRHPGFVLRPPVDPLEFDTGANPAKNEHITLINLDQNKGGMILTRIAQALPHRKFIGVVGSYSQPRKLGQFTRQPPNVEVVAKTARITDIYARTRILIMPSEYESWGMVAQEAACSGIPTISTGTPGLRENCGTAGIYVKDREDTAEWVRHIEALMTDAKLYKSKSEAARKRARQLDPDQPLRDVGNWIRRITFNGLMEPETETKRGKAHGTKAHH
jgi:glycosyltransferase involved in cell wall biosynthesis